MGDLQRAIINYIKYEKLIDDSPLKEQQLETEKRTAINNNLGGVYLPEEAELVYEKNKAIITHIENLKKNQEAKNKEESTIIEYLKLLGESSVKYEPPSGDMRNCTPAYKFFIKDGKLLHNQMK